MTDTTTEPKKKRGALGAITHSSFIQEFKEFINRGSVVDLAIGVAVGGAFTAIVNSLVNDIIMPVTSLLAGGLDFSTLAIDVPNIFGANTTAHIAYGNFLQNVVNFLLIALTIFILVRTLNRLHRKKDAEDAAAEDARVQKHAKIQAEATVKAEANAKKAK